MRLLPVDYAIRNLGRSPTRLVLGVAGSFLVVLLVLSASGFVHGMSRSLGRSGGEKNVILLGAGSEESVERSEVSPAAAGIAAASIPGVKSRLGVPYVSPEAHMAVFVRTAGTNGENHLANFRGVRPEAYLVHDQVRITEGRAPGSGEVLVGRLAESRMGVPDGTLSVGSSLFLDDQEWVVSGRFDAPGTVMEAEIWCPLQELLVATTRETLSSVVLTLDDDGEFEDAALFVKQRLDLELVAMTEAEYYSRVFDFYAPVRHMVWITALLVALGAFFGGLNTLYAAFAARVRELASLQVLGYSRGAILLSLVQESVLLAASGSLLAGVAGLLLLDGLAVRISMGAFGLDVNGTVMALGLGAGALLGLGGALPAAWRCLRLPVATALKSA